jgi:subtilase family protein/PA domain-containing protein
MMPRGGAFAAVAAAAGALLAVPVLAAPGGPGSQAARARALAAAAAWRDTLDAARAPEVPQPGSTESVIVLLRGRPAIAARPAGRAAAAAALADRQAALSPVLASLGATVTFRYRVLVNGLALRLPAGRLSALAGLPDIRAIVPVRYLAPAAAAGTASRPTPLPAERPRPPLSPRAAAAIAGLRVSPRHIALIDGAVDVSHPWLGGAMGPTHPIVGGLDLVDGDGDPTARGGGADVGEAHGTQLAGIVLRAAALRGLPPALVPRLLAYRVLAGERVDGRLRALARTDRVLAALERAVDPNGDGDPSDRADVILLGLAGGFDGGGPDPLAQALRAADRAGSLVVVPAGNDGPSFAAAGTVGGPASVPTALVVGGLGASTSPRTADLRVQLGPAAAALTALPLLGAQPAPLEAPVVVVGGANGLVSGDDPAELRDPSGTSLLRGAIAVVARGGGSLGDKARAAAAAGAVALAVWDRTGDGAFPGPAAGADWPIPVVGLGPRQGDALARVVGSVPGLRARLEPRPVRPAAAAVASFSSRGPTAAGRLEPDLVAPAVGVLTAYPGRAPNGRPLVARLSGTSAAAAEVAAMALRLRVDRPGLAADEARSLMVQAARPLSGAGPADQGAGRAELPGAPPVAIVPPVITGARPARGELWAPVAFRGLAPGAVRYRLVLERTGVARWSEGTVRVVGGARAGINLRIPGHGRFVGRLLVLPVGGGQPLAWAPVFAAPAARLPRAALGTPVVRSANGAVEAQVRIGLLRRAGGTVRSATLHSVRLWLVPEGGGAPMLAAGAKQPGAWPAATYRFALSPRLGDGRPVPAGRYRLRVTARGPEGAGLSTLSAPFTLGTS